MKISPGELLMVTVECLSLFLHSLRLVSSFPLHVSLSKLMALLREREKLGEIFEDKLATPPSNHNRLALCQFNYY